MMKVLRLSFFVDLLVKEENTHHGQHEEAQYHIHEPELAHRLIFSFEGIDPISKYNKKRCEQQPINHFVPHQRFFSQCAGDEDGEADFTTVIKEFRQIFGAQGFHKTWREGGENVQKGAREIR